MKYQIVLEGPVNMADDDFEKLVRGFVNPAKLHSKMKILYAQSLEGIRTEVYEPKQKSRVVIKLSKKSTKRTRDALD